MDHKTFMEELSGRLDISLNSVNTLFESMTGEFSTHLSDLDEIVVAGFGSFEPRLREERIALHPATGKKLLVPPRIYLAFKPSPILKQKVNNGK